MYAHAAFAQISELRPAVASEMLGQLALQFACAWHYRAVRLAISCFFLETLLCRCVCAQERTQHIVVRSSCHIALL